MRGAAGQQRVPDSFFYTYHIPLPPLNEQRRIVALCSKADELRRLPREAQREAQALLPALFEEMFGDLQLNTKNWDTLPFSDIGQLDRGKSQHRPRDAAHLYGGSYPFVQTGDVANANGVITTYSQTYSEAGLAQSKLWPAGTLCMYHIDTLGYTLRRRP